MQLTMFPLPTKSEKPIKPIHHLPDIASMEALQRDKDKDRKILLDYIKDKKFGK
jgi:hypothetical protein